ncbi:class I SAM-dependent methyltransferase [Acidisphaera sp. L21]|uniref:class I SAM-dependent methyltransferase n=1 Tax=Acidisphaera sp. L21 TaxID=1641851 RepID=UPI00131EA17D|nr:class I SAM-dependent methyltransferase [Acidisphaera sp. L21]
MKAIEAVARLVPRNGKVVEVGSLFGSSSWAWAKSVDPSVTVYCIDPWEKNAGVRSMEARYGVSYGLEQFKVHTADCPNIRPMKGYSPNDFLDWSDPIDLYYEDAVHVDPILARNLAFWCGKLKPGGIVCGDDYRPRFPDIRRGARELADRFGREILTVDFFWCLLPGDDMLPGSAAVAETLRELGRQNDALKRSYGPVLSIGPRQPIAAIKPGESASVSCRLANDGVDPWPAEASDGLGVGVRIVAADRPERIVAESWMLLPLPQLEPDAPLDFDLSTPTSTLIAGSYRAIFDLLRPGLGWTMHPSLARAWGFPLEIKGEVAPNPPMPQPAVPAADTPARPTAAQADGAHYVFGTPIAFRAGGQSARYTREGWVPPETRHRWMSGDTSRIVLSVEKLAEAAISGATVHLGMKAKPFLVPGTLDHQSLLISVNGTVVFEEALTAEIPVAAVIPAAVFFAKTPVDVVFRHWDAARPCDLIEGSLDRKTISFAVSELSLTLDLG